MPETEDMTPRCQTILRLVISEYIRTATPVGSKAIRELYHLDISPATIRNEMAWLEEKGYLTHPHTSAGRVPTEKGYRYFVEKLMGESDLPTAERRTIRHQFHQAQPDVEQWMRLAAAVLAHRARGAALVTSPKSAPSRLKHVELISIRDTLALLILVLYAGIVKQRVLTLGAPMTQDELSRIAAMLSHRWEGLHEAAIAATLPGLSEFEHRVGDAVCDMMRRLDARNATEIYRDGLLNLLSQPEFVHSASAQQVVRLLEERQLIDALVSEVLQRGGLQVIIGGEGRWRDLAAVSFVLARYGVEDQVAGALGVLGPLRMRYDRAVSVVRFVAQLMSDLMSSLYGR
ncbi:MAG: heat-inducible transcriptional repressor HrcA [Anaerolineae bacterium]|nr:heat-inducible transcriptional repressor HrcA [Anaerolineae bacterium]